MAIILEVRGKLPKFGKNCFIAENSTITGDVICGDSCSFWFGSVVRGDVNSIRLGSNVNVQDNAVLHCTYKRTKLLIEDNVSIAHSAVVHGCTIRNNVLVGIGAIVLDNAVVEDNVIIAAGTVVKEGQVLESNSVYAGVPARKIKNLDKDMAKEYIERIAKNYLKYSSWYK